MGGKLTGSRAWYGFALILALSLLMASTADAADGPAQVNGADVAWILTSSALVLMMTIPGLALFYGGMVQAQKRSRHPDA